MVRRSIPDPIPLSDAADRESAVAAVLREQEVNSAQVRRWPRGTTPLRLAATLALLVVAGYVWATGPTWLGPAPLPTIDSARDTAGVRLKLALHLQRVLDFRASTGRLPDQLRETGEEVPGVDYQRRDARTFELRASQGTTTLGLEHTLGEPLPRVVRPVGGEVEDGRLLAEGRGKGGEGR